MTQESEASAQGDVEDEGQVSPPPAEDDANGAPDHSTLLGNALLDGLGIHDEPATDEPAGPDEPEAQTDDAGDDEPEATADGEEPPAAEATSPADALERWVTQVADNPKSINQIPAKHHPAVVQAAIEAERAIQRKAAEEAYRLGQQHGAETAVRDARIREAVAEIDALKKDDPEGYVTWRDTYPDKAAAYDQARAPQAATSAADATLTAIVEASKPLVAQLENYPAAKARLAQKAEKDKSLYQMTPEGLAQLSLDISKEIAAEEQAKRAKDEEPARKAVEQRAAAAAQRRDAPRIDAAEGRKGNEPLTNDIEELLRMGIRESRELAHR